MDDVSFVAKLMDWIAGAAAGYAAWIHTQLSETDRSVTELRVEVAKNYVTSAEHDKAIDRVDAKLDLILEKLERKADRH